MPPKKEKQFQQLTDQAFRLVLKIEEQKTRTCRQKAPPHLEQARREIIVAFHSIVRALILLFRIEPGQT